MVHLNRADEGWNASMDKFVEGVLSGAVSMVRVEFPTNPGMVGGGEGEDLDFDFVGFLGGPKQLGPRQVQPSVQKMQEGMVLKAGSWY